jgi:DNA polymerase-1
MERHVVRTIDEVVYQLKNLSNFFAFDTETTSLSYYDLDIEGISFCDGEIAFYIDLINNDDRKDIIKALTETFINATNILAHNIVFDLKVLHKIGIEIPENTELFCTMVADHLIDENRPHGLKYLAKEFLGADTTNYKDIKDHQSEEFYQYAINDAIWTWKLAMLQKDKMSKEAIKLFRNIEMPFQRCLLDMQVNGMCVDLDKADKTKKELDNLKEDLLVELHDIAGVKYQMQFDLFGGMRLVSDLNLNSPIQLAKIITEKLGLKITETTETGAMSVGKKTLEKLQGQHEFIDKLTSYKVVQKLLSAFFEPLPNFVDGDGKVRPDFKDTGTKTGRLSCSNPNLQQLPKTKKGFPSVRECFIAPEGYKMITCDYSGQELRVLTQITKEPVLIDTFIKGKDMHLSTANDFFDLGIDEEDLYETSKNFEETKEKYKEERNKAKVINFGMAYGKGAYGFSKDFNISEAEAESILDKYFAALPAVKTAIDDTHKSVNLNGYVTSLAGRSRHFTRIPDGSYSGGAYRQSFNFLIQGFSADMIRKAMVKVRQAAMLHPAWDLQTVATVHDEAVYYVKKEYVKEACQLIKDEFESAVNFCIPVVADVSIGNNYEEAK